MRLTLREKSECFRGFLLLVAQDRVVSPEEKELMCHIGKALDFDSRFCEEAVEDLLENALIATNPPVFSRREHAEAFLYDCIRIADADHKLHPDEVAWIVRIAEANGLPGPWVEEAIEKLRRESPDHKTARMEIEAFI